MASNPISACATTRLIANYNLRKTVQSVFNDVCPTIRLHVYAWPECNLSAVRSMLHIRLYALSIYCSSEPIKSHATYRRAIIFQKRHTTSAVRVFSVVNQPIRPSFSNPWFYFKPMKIARQFHVWFPPATKDGLHPAPIHEKRQSKRRQAPVSIPMGIA